MSDHERAHDDEQQDLRAAREEARELYDRLARVSAELDNFRKRQAAEQKREIHFANEALLLALIPVVDGLERALASEGDVVTGVRLVKKQLEDALARFGAAPFSTVGEPFDPTRAEAVAVREDDGVPPNTVLEQHERGWSLNGKLVRPARVVVTPAGEMH